jgi:hypothetical protein
MSFYSTATRSALGPMGTGALSSEVKWLGSEANHSSPSSAEVKNGGIMFVLCRP